MEKTKVLFIIDEAAYKLVTHCLRDHGFQLGICVHVRIDGQVYLEASIENDAIKQYLLNKRFRIKGIEKIYIMY